MSTQFTIHFHLQMKLVTLIEKLNGYPRFSKSIYQHSFGKKTIYNIVNALFLTTDKAHNFEREELKQLLTFVAYESFFAFDAEYYTQIDCVAMESSSS